MKKLLALVSLLVMAACTSESLNKNLAVDTNKNTNDAAKTTVALSEAEAIAKEKAIWETIKNKDYEGFGNMLADGQIEVVPEGVFDKATTIARVKDFEPNEVTFADWKYLPINKNAVVVTYTVTVKGKYKGADFGPESARASSAWVNRDGKWLGVYHQECEVKPAPAAMASTSPAKTAASPAVSPAATPAMLTLGSDPIANEKAIWDAFKAKNFEGFAAALAPEFLELNTAGVYDKAGTVSEVKKIDFSKAELSEFRAVPFDADAAVVTYMVKLPGPEPAERHSTIWANRNGRWLVVFHHGTPARPSGPPAPPKPAK